MEILYLGNTSFTIKGERVVAVDPPRQTLPADVILFSKRKNRPRQIVDGPGEYEIKDVLITTLEVRGKGDAALCHAIDLAGTRVVFLPGTFTEPDSGVQNGFGRVDVLMLYVGDVQASQETIRRLSPHVVLPFGPKATEFCVASGDKAPKAESRFIWNGTGVRQRAVLLRAQASRKQVA